MNDLRHYKIGTYCRFFRMHVLEKTLKEVEGNENIKALSSFEHGYSTNLNHLIKYVSACENKEMKIRFLQELINVIEGENIG